MTTSVLILGGGRWQLGIIRAAKSLALRAIVTDISAEAPGRLIADEFHRIDTNDRVALVDLARRCQVTLVLAEQTDRLVPVAAFINDALGLRGIDGDTAERFTNKLTMRTALAAADVPMPRYKAVSSARTAADALDWVGLPAIIKPLQAQSSIGVTLIRSRDEIAPAVDAALAAGASREILIEEFIDGLEVTVEALSLNGVATPLAISEKAHYSHRPCVARLLAYPPRLPDETIKRIRDTAKRVVEHLGLRDGLSHAEYRVRSGVPYLVEVAARGGGSGIASTIVPHVSGVDIYSIVIRRLLGEDVHLPALQENAAILEFFDFAPGPVMAVNGIAECLDKGLARELEVPYSRGDVIRGASDDRDRPGRFISLGLNRDQVDAQAVEVKRRVTIQYADPSES